MNHFKSIRPLAALPALLVALTLSYALIAGCGAKSGDSTPSDTAPPVTAAPDDTPPTSAADTAATGATADAALGAKVFTQRCVLCHGASGHGDGVGSKGLNPKPRNFHDKAYMSSRTDAQLLEIIDKGKGVMPAWGKVLTEAEMQAALGHVRSFAGQP